MDKVLYNSVASTFSGQKNQINVAYADYSTVSTSCALIGGKLIAVYTDGQGNNALGICPLSSIPTLNVDSFTTSELIYKSDKLDAVINSAGNYVMVVAPRILEAVSFEVFLEGSFISLDANRSLLCKKIEQIDDIDYTSFGSFVAKLNNSWHLVVKEG